MRLGDLVNVIESLNVLVQKPLKTAIGYKIAVFLKKVEPEYNTFTTKRDELIKSLGSSEDGQKYLIKPENIQTYNDQFGELVETEVDIRPPKIKLSDIQDIEIEGKYLFQLTDIIEDDSISAAPTVEPVATPLN